MNDNSQKFTRRNFLKLIGLAGGTTALASWRLEELNGVLNHANAVSETNQITFKHKNKLSLTTEDNKTTYYIFSTNDRIEKVSGNRDDAIFGNKATGNVSDETDIYRFKGAIKEFHASNSNLIIKLNGNKVSREELIQRCGTSNLSQYRGTFVDYKDSFFNSRQCATPDEYGAAGDGSQDDSAAIKSAIENNACIKIPDGTYRVDSTMAFSGIENKLIKGPGEIKFNSGSRGQMFMIENSQKIYFRNLSLNGNQNQDADTSAFKFNRCTNLAVNNCEIYNWGDHDSVQSDYHTIAADSSQKAEFIGNFIHDVSAKGVSWYTFGGDARPNHECLMANNKTRRTGEDGLFAGSEQTRERAEQILFIENDIKNTRDNYGIRVGGNQPCNAEIRQNKIENPHHAAITVKTLGRTQGNVTQNTCIGGGINFKTSNKEPISGTIKNNTIENTEQGIRLIDGCEDVDIIGNTTYQILLDGGRNFLIENNDIGAGGIVRQKNPQNVQISSN